jgi:hypothetical protein
MRHSLRIVTTTPGDYMTAADWAATLSGFTATAAFIGVIGSWIMRTWMKSFLSELKPNGGSSLNDKINLEIIPMLKELRGDQIVIGEKVAKLEGRFEQHLDDLEDL